MSRNTSIQQVRTETLGAVEARVEELVAHDRLRLPPNYSAANALQAAWLQLQGMTVGRDKTPVLDKCSRNSVVQALFAMVVQGLDVGRQQGYFIPYGNSLTFQRSYHGALALAKRTGEVRDAVAEVVYQGDDFEFAIEGGRKVVTRHVQTLKSIDSDEPIAAYAVVLLADGRTHTELMTMKQVRQSWGQSRANPESADSTHSKFADEMIRRTVLNRALKRYINSSTDAHLFPVAEQSGDEAIEAEALEHANATLVEIEDDRYEQHGPEAQPEPDDDPFEQPKAEPVESTEDRAPF